MKEINEEETKKYGLSVSEYLEENYKGVLTEEQALVVVLNDKTNGIGYMLGVATKGQKGYQETLIILSNQNWNVVSKWVDEANNKIFNRSSKETAKIVFSTMF